MLPSAQALLNVKSHNDKTDSIPESEKFNNEPFSLEICRIQGSSDLESHDVEFTWNEIEMSRSKIESVSLESLLEVDCWGSNTTVGNTVNIYTSTPLGQQNMTRIQGTKKHLVISLN